MERAKNKWTNPFILKFQLRLADTDSLGHINNVAYIAFLETLRTEWHNHIGGSRESLEVWDWILGDMQVRFLHEGYLSDTLTGYMWCSHIGTKSWEFSYAIVNQNDEILVEAKTIQIAYDYAKKISLEIPERIKNDLESRYGKSWEF